MTRSSAPEAPVIRGTILAESIKPGSSFEGHGMRIISRPVRRTAAPELVRELEQRYRGDDRLPRQDLPVSQGRQGGT
jgi:hypothetical protein